MAIQPIRLFGDPVLRQRSAEVALVDEAVRKLMRDMIDTMRAAPGVGLAAPQIGVLRRVIVWENEEEAGSLANPVISDRRGSDVADEGCLSIPGLNYPVERSEWIEVTGIDEEGNTVHLEAKDYTARIIQHEIDHIDGVLFIDRLPEDLQRDAKRTLRQIALADPASSF